ncbi:MAG: hypothetical protein LUQ22_05625 [Methanotrichaceae archaeon]|nr:hypothetical protein [Methanotrichaceae archaeon]
MRVTTRKSIALDISGADDHDNKQLAAEIFRQLQAFVKPNQAEEEARKQA